MQRDTPSTSSVAESGHVGHVLREIEERERRGTARHLATEYAVTRILADPKPLIEMLPELLEAICAAGEWQVGAIWTVDEMAGLLRCIDFWHAPGVLVDEFAAITCEKTFPSGVGLPGRIWATAKSLWIENLSAESNFPRAASAVRCGLHSGFGFPLRAGQRTIGVLECFTDAATRPDAELLRLFDAIGAQIGQFMERRDVEVVRERLAAIVDSSDDAIVSKTLDGVITSWNRGAENIFGFTAAEAVGKHISLIIPAERHAEESEVLARLRRGQKIDHFETKRQTKDGRLLDISLTVSPVRNADGLIVGASKVARDITAWKRTEEALRRSEQEARSAAQARDEFLSMAAHELRNPLNALQLQLVGLHRAALDPDAPLPRDLVADRLGQVTEDVGSLVRLVHNLLDVARITAGRMDLEPENVELKTLVATVANRFRTQLKEDQLTLRVEPMFGHWDRLRLDQAITNLLSNAIKYGEGKPIEISVTVDGDVLKLSVADHGIGIEPANQERLFEPFERAVPRRQYGGFGLGLWITRETVRVMGGSISLESQPGIGSTFTISLPRNQQRLEGPGPRTGVPSTP